MQKNLRKLPTTNDVCATNRDRSQAARRNSIYEVRFRLEEERFFLVNERLVVKTYLVSATVVNRQLMYFFATFIRFGSLKNLQQFFLCLYSTQNKTKL